MAQQEEEQKRIRQEKLEAAQKVVSLWSVLFHSLISLATIYT